MHSCLLRCPDAHAQHLMHPCMPCHDSPRLGIPMQGCSIILLLKVRQHGPHLIVLILHLGKAKSSRGRHMRDGVKGGSNKRMGVIFLKPPPSFLQQHQMKWPGRRLQQPPSTEGRFPPWIQIMIRRVRAKLGGRASTHLLAALPTVQCHACAGGHAITGAGLGISTYIMY